MRAKKDEATIAKIAAISENMKVSYLSRVTD